MPRVRQSGAQRPYRYTHSWYTVENGQRVRHERKRWRVRLELGTDADGKRIRKTITADTSRECMEKLRKAREEYAKTGTVRSRSTVTFGHYLDLYMDNAKHHLMPNTYSVYLVAAHRLDKWRHHRIDSFTPLTVDSMLEDMMREGTGYDAIRQTRTVIRGAFGMAVRDRAITTNPATDVGMPVRKPESNRRAFTVPEIRAFLEATIPLGDDGAAIWWWRFFTGMRQGELLGAELKNLHLDAENPYYLVTGSATRVSYDHGCGRNGSGWSCGHVKGHACPDRVPRVPDGVDMRPLSDTMWLKTPKNGKPRWVPLSPELVEVTRRYLKAVEGRPNPLGLLFPNADGSPRTVRQDNAEFDMLLEKAGMDPKQRTGHETRYSAVTLMRRAGVDRKAEREIIGHVDDRVDDVYMTVDAEQKMEAVESIGRQLRLEPPVE